MTEPVKRDCFTYGQKRIGGNLILSCEPPVPWSKIVDPFKVQTSLTKFMAQAYFNVTVNGPREAHELKD